MLILKLFKLKIRIKKDKKLKKRIMSRIKVRTF